MTRRSALLALPFAALLGLTGCAGPFAAPARTPIPARSAPRIDATQHAELMRSQARLDPVAQEIQELVAPHDEAITMPLPSGDDRYGEVRLDLEGDRVELWWAGPLPTEVRSILDRHPDVVVDVYRAPYSSDELHRAGGRVAARLMSGAFGHDVTMDMIEHDVRAGRIVVHAVDPHGRWTTATLLPRLKAIARVPVVLELTRGSTLAPLGFVASTG